MSLTRWLVPIIAVSTLALGACAEPAVAPVSPVAPDVGVEIPVASVSASTCTPGYYDPDGGSNCIAATPGTFVAISGATMSVSCLPGTFSSQPASTRCRTAQPGYYTPFPRGGGTYEIPCGDGRYQPSSGQTSCLIASAGYYVAGEANTTQTACVAGTFQPARGSASCIDASIGYFAVGTAATFQTPCAIGTFSPVQASTACTPAPAGSYVAAIGQGAATACVPGTYQPAEGQASCLEADVGYYVDASNAIAQTVCPAGLTTFTTGATSLALCVRLFDWQGFDSRLDATVLNAAKAGSVVLVRFSLGADEGLGVFQPGFPTSAAIACTGGATTSAETETDSAGQSTLSYDATTGQYKYIWKTEKGWNGTCRRLTIKFSDTSVRTIDFQFTK